MYQSILISGKTNQLLQSQEASEKMKWPDVGGTGRGRENHTNSLYDTHKINSL
jgi:hypothetical protein